MEQRVKAYTLKRIIALQNTARASAANAQLAVWRRGIGHKPGELPALWGAFLADMPEEFYGRDGNPSREEWAVYTALTLFALHQQGKDVKTECVSSTDGCSVGKAAGKLIESEDDRERITKRFNAAATASDMIETAYYLRSLVQLLKANDIGLDYPRLAEDLYWIQIPSVADRVRLQWGQDFYRVYQTNDDPDGSQRKEDQDE